MEIAEERIAACRAAGGRWLDLSGLGLRELPFGICACHELEILLVHGNRLKSLGGAVAGLRRLRVVNLNANAIEGLDGELSGCLGLRELHVYGNRLTELPLEIGQLSWLEVLDILLVSKQLCLGGHLD